MELLRSKPSFATQRDDYVLGEMDHINRQLQCEFMTPFLLKSFHLLALCFEPIAFWPFAGFVPDAQQESRRVNRLLDNAVDVPTTGRKHFYLDKVHARTLATLKDRVWRNAQVLEMCRPIFTRLNYALFPSGPQPQGLFPLIDIFRVTDSVKESLMQLAIRGSNATMAYIRDRKPNFSIRPPATGTLVSQSHLIETRSAAEELIDCCKEQLFGSVLDTKDEPDS